MKYLVLALLMAGCAAAPTAPLAGPTCSCGLCVYDNINENEAKALCGLFFGVPYSGCWNPDIRVGVISGHARLDPVVCGVSDDPARCRQELFNSL